MHAKCFCLPCQGSKIITSSAHDTQTREQQCVCCTRGGVSNTRLVHILTSDHTQGRATAHTLGTNTQEQGHINHTWCSAGYRLPVVQQRRHLEVGQHAQAPRHAAVAVPVDGLAQRVGGCLARCSVLLGACVICAVVPCGRAHEQVRSRRVLLALSSHIACADKQQVHGRACSETSSLLLHLASVAWQLWVHVHEMAPNTPPKPWTST